MRSGKVTGADVARAAGVSPSTVSFVLNQTPGQTIPEETRKRVMAAIRKLGYIPDMAGRTLRTGRSNLVVWILPDWPIGSVIGTLIESLSREAGLRRFALAIVHEGEGQASLEDSLRMLAPSAIVAMHPLPDSVSELARTAGIPIATTSYSPGADSQPFDFVAAASRRVGEMQVRYLAEHGHTRIAYLYPSDRRLQDFVSNRFDGARNTAKELGLPAVRKHAGSSDLEKLGKIAQDWRAAGITAVCAYNDEWAMQLLDAMQEAGLTAPTDLAVIGVDNERMSSRTVPPLTTIEQDMSALSVALMNTVERALGRAVAENDAHFGNLRIIERQSA